MNFTIMNPTNEPGWMMLPQDQYQAKPKTPIKCQCWIPGVGWTGEEWFPVIGTGPYRVSYESAYHFAQANARLAVMAEALVRIAKLNQTVEMLNPSMTMLATEQIATSALSSTLPPQPIRREVLAHCVERMEIFKTLCETTSWLDTCWWSEDEAALTAANEELERTK